MPADWYMKTANSFHRGLIKISGGRVGWSAIGMSVVELTTIGAKSGRPRRVMLTSPLEEGDTIVIVASAGGNPAHPAWYHNIVANPAVEVVYRGRPQQRMHARVATPEERARMWPILTTAHKNYAGYEEKTDREIPLVLLERVSAAP
jgi:deazaflavin-dependent oxidoreductase (nitroreductase family)